MIARLDYADGRVKVVEYLVESCPEILPYCDPADGCMREFKRTYWLGARRRPIYREVATGCADETDDDARRRESAEAKS